MSGPQEVTKSQHGDTQWLLARQSVCPSTGGLTASVLPDICHVGYKTAIKRWKIATGIDPEPLATGYLKQLLDYGRNTEKAALGILRELGVMDRGRSEHHLVAMEETGFWVNDAYPKLGATPDAVLRGYDDSGACVWTEPIEVKCPKDTTHKVPGSEEWTRYIIQLECQCRVLDAIAGHLFIYGNNEEDDSQYSYYWYHQRDDALWSVITHYHTRYIWYCITHQQPPRATETEKFEIVRWMDDDRKAFNRRLFYPTKYSEVCCAPHDP